MAHDAGRAGAAALENYTLQRDLALKNCTWSWLTLLVVAIVAAGVTLLHHYLPNQRNLVLGVSAGVGAVAILGLIYQCRQYQRAYVLAQA